MEKLIYLYNFNNKRIKEMKQEYLYNLAQIYEFEDNFYEAEFFFKKAIEEGVKEACNQLGILYLKRKEKKKAIRVFQQGEEMLDLHSIINLAILAEEENKNDQAIKLYQKAYDHGYRSKLIKQKIGVGE